MAICATSMTGRRADGRQLEVAVDHPELPLTGGGNAGLQQFAIEGLSFVTQGIVLGREDMGRRQSRKIRMVQRARLGMAGRAACPDRPETR